MSAMQLGVLILLPRNRQFFYQWCCLNQCDPICPIWHTHRPQSMKQHIHICTAVFFSMEWSCAQYSYCYCTVIVLYCILYCVEIEKNEQKSQIKQAYVGVTVSLRNAVKKVMHLEIQMKCKTSITSTHNILWPSLISLPRRNALWSSKLISQSAM